MATKTRRRKENVPGLFFVDDTCIDCDTCRWMAPDIFGRDGGLSSVIKQPQSESELNSAMQALISCPTSSIGVEKKVVIQNDDLFPIQIEDNVFHLGFHDQKSYGATPYLIIASGYNIMIDVPRYTPKCLEILKTKGGIDYIFLSHQDDIADQEKFSSYFGAKRIMHASEAHHIPNLEISFEDTFKFNEDIEIIHTPGHSKGSSCLLYQNRFLFSGDHIAYNRFFKHLYAFRGYCQNWQELVLSIEKLQDYKFNWVLPGHSARFYANTEDMKKQLELCLKWAKQQ